MPNQAVVAGSCCTNPCPSRRNLATSSSLPGFASSLTNKAFVVMSCSPCDCFLPSCGSYLFFRCKSNRISRQMRCSPTFFLLRCSTDSLYLGSCGSGKQTDKRGSESIATPLLGFREVGVQGRPF